MKLIDIINPQQISCDLRSTGKMDVLSELGELLAGGCPQVRTEAIVGVLVERERLATTGVGEGVAIPHGKIEGIGCLSAAIGISRTGISFDAVDGEPVHIFFALLAPLSSSGDHLRALARASRLLKDPAFRQRLLEAADPLAALEVIREEDARN